MDGHSTPARSGSSRNVFDDRKIDDLTNQFRQILSTKRMNELSSKGSLLRTGSQSARNRDYSSPLPQESNNLPSYSALRNIPLIPQAPADSRSIRFRNMLHTLSSMPCKWENPGLLDEALKSVPLELIYNDAEEESQIMEAEAQSLGPGKKAAWGYQDCVIRALMRWFKTSFFSWVTTRHAHTAIHPPLASGWPRPHQTSLREALIRLSYTSARSKHALATNASPDTTMLLSSSRLARVALANGQTASACSAALWVHEYAGCGTLKITSG